MTISPLCVCLPVRPLPTTSSGPSAYLPAVELSGFLRPVGANAAPCGESLAGVPLSRLSGRFPQSGHMSASGLGFFPP